MKLGRSRVTIVPAAMVLVAGACAGGTAIAPTAGPTTAGPATTTTTVSPTTVSTTAGPATTTTVTAVPALDEAILDEQVDGVVIPWSVGALMVVMMNAEGEVAYAARGTDPEGNSPTPQSPFRIASITKVFTALATLSLVDEGLIDLDDPAVDYVSRVPVPVDVTVRDLLRHTSGIPEFFDDPELEIWLADPGRIWTPEETIGLIAGHEPVFPPGSEWHWGYSNTNYIVLGVLIEEVTGRSLAEVLRARIIEPLGMGSTYVAGFEDGPGVFGAYATSFVQGPPEPIDFAFTSIATATSAAGGIVSTALDLHTLFTALFGGRLLSAASLAEMIEDPHQANLLVMANESDYGLGIQVWTRFGGRPVEGLVGHGGDVVGYRTLVAHAPETGMTAFWVATSPAIDMSTTYAAVAERLGSP